MNFDLNILKRAERTALQLRALAERAGYRKYHMGRFEEYGLYQQNRSFLASEQVLTFTDLDGRLLALKPDVTLSIAKNVQPAPGKCEKYYYNEKVYRPSRESHTFVEIDQMGLECMGTVTQEDVLEQLRLALDALALCGTRFRLELSHMGFLTGLLDALKVQEPLRPALLEQIRRKSAHGLRQECAKIGLADAADLCALLELSGPVEEILTRAGALVKNDQMAQALAELAGLCRQLPREEETVTVDLSLAGDMEYYNGLVFQGYLSGLAAPVLKGGRYDLLARKFTPGISAVGFALYLDDLDRLESVPAAEEHTVLNVALPKGRLGDKVYNLLAQVGYGCEENYNDTRKLVVENRAAGIRYFLVKPSDVAIYVEHGAADVGIVGKDILTESNPDVYELLDTGLGKCRMCVAGRNDFVDDPGRALRVATKFVNIAKEYYGGLGRDIDIIKLNGSIELAPILGLSDVIVDIVETGTTLKENDLKVLTEFLPISARFIANKASYTFKKQALTTLLEKLQEVIG
ncbi:MAG: ATP phosphoribosyltransferase [Clostridia bacterium]|nr:ATP phosphoribosyltransferase [Clostridia bacterium]